MQQCRRLTLPTSALPMAIMSDDLPDSLIPYDEIVQEALRAVVGRVLREIESSGGLPGSHHFYITFKTGAAGVSIPKHLTERFPDEMTIVLQNKFRSEEHTSELQSLMRISYAVFCLKKKKNDEEYTHINNTLYKTHNMII